MEKRNEVLRWCFSGWDDAGIFIFKPMNYNQFCQVWNENMASQNWFKMRELTEEEYANHKNAQI